MLKAQTEQRIQDLIRLHAYYIWQSREPGNSELQDWLDAEEYVKESYSYLFFRLHAYSIHITAFFGGLYRCTICQHPGTVTEQPRVQCECCGEILELRPLSNGAHTW